MELNNEFEVAADPRTVWDYLLDVEQVAPCMPGAELTEVVDDETWKGTVTVKLGPVSLKFAGKVVVAERDADAHRMVLKANGSETRGKGTAQATVTSSLEPAGSGTRVTLSTDLTLSGAAAQYGRGMVADVSKRLTEQFANCLQRNLTTARPPPPRQPAAAEASDGGSASTAGDTSRRTPATAEPVAGVRLALWTLWRAVVRGFRRLTDRGA